MASYKRFIRLLEKWPVDKTKGERDLGFYLRHQLKEQFPIGEGTKVNESQWSQKLDSLERLAENQYQNKHPLAKDFLSATGLSAEECRAALSREFLDAIKKENSRGLFKRIFNKD